MAHYLLAVSPIRGHVMPMVDIGVGLQTLGHEVTVLTGGEFAELVRGAGLGLRELPVRIAAPPGVPAWVRALPDEARRFRLGRAELASVFTDPLVAQASSLHAALAAHPYDAVLADVAFTGALPLLLGDRPRPPVVVCGVGPLTLSSADTPPFGMAWQPVPGTDYRPMTAVAHRVIMRSSQRRFDRALRLAGAPRAPVFVSDWPRLADGIVQLCTADFEYPRGDLPSTVEFVGPVPTRADPGVALPAWWPDVLAAETVVHVTQGTFDNADPDQLIGPTLEALGGDAGPLVVVTTGRRGGLPGRIPSNARVAPWIPYAALLPHVDVMVTNGGYGGVQHALAHGVPLVVAGETSDKAEVAARVAYTGVGVDLRVAHPTAAAVRAATERVLSEAAYRGATARMARVIASSAPIDAVANTLKRLSDPA